MKSGWTIVAAVAYLLATLLFASYLPRTIGNPKLLLGTFLLVAGYGTLGVQKAYQSRKKEDEHEEKPNKIGYAFLVAFYGLSFLIPISFTVQMYDLLAVAGYGLLLAGLQFAGICALLLYYVFGAVRKFTDSHMSHDPIRILGMGLVRLGLAVYYGATILHL